MHFLSFQYVKELVSDKSEAVEYTGIEPLPSRSLPGALPLSYGGILIIILL